MWDFGGDGFQSFEGPCILEGANLSLEPYCLMDGDEDETLELVQIEKRHTDLLYFGWFNAYLVVLRF